MKARIEIMNPETGIRLEGKSEKELKSVFLSGNVITYYIIKNDRPLTFEQKRRIESGTVAFNFVFDTDNRNAIDEIEFFKSMMREMQKNAPRWFDKRTKEYKNAFSYPNGFNTPLLFNEI